MFFRHLNANLRTSKAKVSKNHGSNGHFQNSITNDFKIEDTEIEIQNLKSLNSSLLEVCGHSTSLCHVSVQ